MVSQSWLKSAGVTTTRGGWNQKLTVRTQDRNHCIHKQNSRYRFHVDHLFTFLFWLFLGKSRPYGTCWRPGNQRTKGSVLELSINGVFWFQTVSYLPLLLTHPLTNSFVQIPFYALLHNAYIYWSCCCSVNVINLWDFIRSMFERAMSLFVRLQNLACMKSSSFSILVNLFKP